MESGVTAVSAGDALFLLMFCGVFLTWLGFRTTLLESARLQCQNEGHLWKRTEWEPGLTCERCKRRWGV